MKPGICPLLVALVVALCLTGCAGISSTAEMAPKLETIESAKMPILASVLRHLGDKYPAVPKYWLDVTASEFKWLERDFESQPPRFKYAQLERADRAVGDILYVRWIRPGPKRATARGGCRGKGYFEDYLLHLVNERGVWRVVSCELICVS